MSARTRVRTHTMAVVTSVTPERRLGSARIRLELLSKKLGSARAIFQKARIEKILLIRAF